MARNDLRAGGLGGGGTKRPHQLGVGVARSATQTASIYIKISCLSVVSVTLCLLRQIISSIYIKIICMYFCVEGLNVKTGNCINILKYFDNC